MNLPMDEQPKMKLLRYGIESISNIEILSIIIGKGTKERNPFEIAMDVISINDKGIGALANCRVEELKKINGIGENKACEIIAAVELGRRISSRTRSNNPKIETAREIVNLYMERMRSYRKEYFVCLMLSAKGEILCEEIVSIGDLTSSITHPREVFTEPVRRSAASVVFLHNHPSGDPKASDLDVKTTKRLMQVGDLLGIPVLDHIIFGNGEFVSMKAQGLI